MGHRQRHDVLGQDLAQAAAQAGRSPKVVTSSARTVFGAQNSSGTGWKLCDFIRLGVEWSPVTISTSGFRPISFGTSASSASITETFLAKSPSSPVLSVYL